MKEQKLQEDKDELEMEFGSFFDNSDSDDEESEKTKNKFNQKIYRDLIINCFDFKLIEKYHPMFENDEEVLSVAIGSKQNYLKYASEILKKNKHFMIKCVDKFLPKISGEKIFNLKYLKDFLDDKDVIRKLVEKSPGSFSLDNMLEIWKDENFLEECLMINPDLLKYVPVKNMDLTIKTLIQKPEILENYSLTKEQYILLIEQKARISYFHIPLYLKEDMDFMELFLNNCDIPYSIDLKFEDSILKDRNMVKLILQKLPSYLSKLKEKYQNDRELVELAVSCNPKSLVHASMELKDDRELVLFVLENLTKPKANFIETISDRLKNDRLVMMEAVKKTAYSFIFASEELQFDLKFVVDSLDYNREVLEFIDSSFKKDIDIQMILEGMYHKLRMKNERIAHLSDMNFNFVRE